MSWLKVMAWDLGSNLDEEAERAIVTAQLGSSRAAALFPAYPLDGHEPIVSRGTVVGKAFDPTARRSSARPLGGGLGVGQLRDAADVLARVTKINQTVSTAAGWRAAPGAGEGVELLGRGGGQNRERPGDPVQRSPPGHLHPVGLRPGRAALPDGDRHLPVRRLRLQPGVGAGRGDRQERHDRLGAHHQLPRHAGSLHRAGAGRHRTGRRQLRGAAGDHRGDPGAGRGPAADHSHPVLPARSAAVRRGPVAAADGWAARRGRRADLRGRPGLDGPHPRPDHGRRAQPRPSAGLRAVPRGGRPAERAVAEPDVRRHPGQHRLSVGRHDARAGQG